MSLRRMLRRASGFLILGICMQFASVLLQGGLSAQTAPQAGPKTGDGSAVSAQDKQKLAASAIKLPLFFEANQGQTDPSVRFLTRSGGYTMFLTPTETVLVEGKNGSAGGEKFEAVRAADGIAGGECRAGISGSAGAAGESELPDREE